jgi:protein-disulfide isomerase
MSVLYRTNKLYKEGTVMKRGLVSLILMMFLLALISPVAAKSADDINALKKEVEALKEGQKAIQKDIQDIKKQLSTKQTPPAPPAFKEAIIDLNDSPFKGKKDAKVTIAEFSDYQ